MKIHFEKVIVPCVADEVTLWHLEHGWVWDVVEYSGDTRRCLGVLYCTLLSGDGVIMHFSTVPGIRIRWQSVLCAMRKAVRMIASSPINVIYATVPEDNVKLIRTACALGFGITDGGFVRNGSRIALLKYFERKKAIV